ncbi:adenosylcobinamide-phosphate synthase CbiB (plasmid) [Ralstonia syzygii subsp. celebesensis]|uniref:Cobalamin biosynthesis protein CobD n=3 Tax=Ralstonia solanacearum species complex TaxID=3116862 RepID=A0AAD0S5Q0_RALSL|nr:MULTISPECIES: adenosylcobinamide-phosphate synthase CbiB [Ralstonia solanacearum species complex]CCA82606.1 cobalamin biosynthesis protein cobD [blood disease bacterium R229]AQW31896.1 cobalamin biosynthesis protein [blood disease bacterium A2-HR MARDI]AXV80895.1 cobalamin biosynthesis protein [Ralstonia solanacearum]AXW52042.1 cobalamin biosynthesis protein [Ralstonia solanacearum]QQV57295.1 cobalamin biosynthesis protein [Ralstonia syzygii subsp. celebesensis]
MMVWPGNVSDLGLPVVALAALAGVGLDRLLGEVPRWHPLVGFGRVAAWIERGLNRRPAARVLSRVAGIAAWCIAVLPFVAITAWIAAQTPDMTRLCAWIADVIALYLAIGARSLRDHIAPIAEALRGGDLPRARGLASRIVSRDLRDADEEAIARAAVESALENGSDAIFAPLFWLVVGGAPGVVLYRLANTLDAMWGYRNARFGSFGWAAARIDDVLNWIPARLTALSYALLGHTADALRCWRSQAPRWSSPNAGPVMASGAGSLRVQLGGMARYDGLDETRPPLGLGRPARATDIRRALALVSRTLGLWLVILAAGGALAFAGIARQGV